ncbi:ArsR family transcriptional regulator [Kosmotoga arenicorallina S304]|uniref:ArsR family transcriptional regulator n=1 Tax=Kosmotoga arenicorallina S304 TaxID=1453497 RepID=A0A176K1Z5_9BACT|nr:winged helix-turn-helix domain-containing protein [Kosmotoga arenicorallina]OAA31040.1 ArsR family transcriptional regulator [Kosmotoga arenicorallina S304]
MKIVAGYFEIYDLMMAIYYAFHSEPVRKSLKSLGVDFNPAQELLAFREAILKETDWSTRIYTTFMNEFGVISPVLFPVKHKMVDGTAVRIEESIELSPELMEMIRDRFITVLAVRRLNMERQELKRLLDTSPFTVTEKVEEIEGISSDSKWFANQLLLFPVKAMEFLVSNTRKILKLYEKTGLRAKNLRKISDFFSSINSKTVKNAIENYLDYYDLAPDASRPLYVALQNSIPRSNSGLMSYPTFHLLIMGVEEITKDFLKKIPQEYKLSNLLKAIGDHSRFEILRYLARKPSTQKELADFTGLNKSTISYHINLLFKASLIDIDVFNNIITLREETIKKLAMALGETFGL